MSKIDTLKSRELVWLYGRSPIPFKVEIDRQRTEVINTQPFSSSLLVIHNRIQDTIKQFEPEEAICPQ